MYLLLTKKSLCKLDTNIKKKQILESHDCEL